MYQVSRRECVGFRGGCCVWVLPVTSKGYLPVFQKCYCLQVHRFSLFDR